MVYVINLHQYQSICPLKILYDVGFFLLLLLISSVKHPPPARWQHLHLMRMTCHPPPLAAVLAPLAKELTTSDDPAQRANVLGHTEQCALVTRGPVAEDPSHDDGNGRGGGWYRQDPLQNGTAVEDEQWELELSRTGLTLETWDALSRTRVT